MRLVSGEDDWQFETDPIDHWQIETGVLFETVWGQKKIDFLL